MILKGESMEYAEKLWIAKASQYVLYTYFENCNVRTTEISLRNHRRLSAGTSQIMNKKAGVNMV